MADAVFFVGFSLFALFSATPNILSCHFVLMVIVTFGRHSFQNYQTASIGAFCMVENMSIEEYTAKSGLTQLTT